MVFAFHNLIYKFHAQAFQFTKFVDRQIQVHPWAGKVFLGIGTYYVLRQVLNNLPPRLFKFDLRSRYGPDSWAIVTGASDGIGRGFCYALAKQGFNIVLVSRTVEKMDVICKDLQEKFKVQTMIIRADFSNGHEVSFFQEIARQVQDFDISILVNNVGISDFEDLYEKMTIKDAFNTLIVNAGSTLFTTKVLIDKLLNRPHKSAVITVSSVLGHYAVPFSAAYNASKAFQDYVSLSLVPQYQHQIDFLSLCPGAVQTNMLPIKGKYTISADECAESALNELRWGKTRTFGHANHQKFVNERFGFGQNVQQNQINVGTNLKKLNEYLQAQQEKKSELQQA